MSDSTPSTRRNFRTPVSAKTRLTLVDESQKHALRKCFDLKMFEEAYPAHDNATTQLMSMFVEMFKYLDNKLDKICDLLEKDDPDNRSLDVVDTVDISGSGVSVLLRQQVEPGLLVHLSMTFTGSHLGVMDVLGRVVRSAPGENDEEDMYYTGIEFVDLSESEKDLLVKYTFSQQRKQIRTAGEKD